MLLRQILKAILHFGEAHYLFLEKVHGNVDVIVVKILARRSSLKKKTAHILASILVRVLAKINIQYILALHVPNHGFLLPLRGSCQDTVAFQEMLPRQEISEEKLLIHQALNS
jgi:hypothetical protein